MKQLMSNAGEALDANDNLYWMVKSVQPEWAKKITEIIRREKTQKEIADVSHEKLLNWIAEAMHELRMSMSEDYVNWHKKYDDLKKQFEEHMQGMGQNTQHADGSNLTSDPPEHANKRSWRDVVEADKKERKIANVHVDRQHVGQVLYDKVVNIVETPEHARKITGMILEAVPWEIIQKDINDIIVVADWVIKCLETKWLVPDDNFMKMRTMADEFKEWLNKQTKIQANKLTSYWDRLKLNGNLNNADKRDTNLNQMEHLIREWGESDLINNEHDRILQELEKESNPWLAFIRNYMHRHILLAERDVMEMVIDKIDPKDLGKKYLQKYALEKAREQQQKNQSWWFPKHMTKSLRQMVAWKKAVNAEKEEYGRCTGRKKKQ